VTECVNCKAILRSGFPKIIVNDKPYCTGCGGKFYGSDTGIQKPKGQERV